MYHGFLRKKSKIVDFYKLHCQNTPLIPRTFVLFLIKNIDSIKNVRESRIRLDCITMRVHHSPAIRCSCLVINMKRFETQQDSRLSSDFPSFRSNRCLRCTCSELFIASIELKTSLNKYAITSRKSTTSIFA